MSKERRKLCLALAVIFAVNLLAIAVAQNAAAQTYKKGSSGQTVTQIQTKLRDWGYYSGTVDGVYGSKTAKAAAAYWQRKGWSKKADVWNVGANTVKALARV